MLQAGSIWLLVAGFVGAGIVNAFGMAGTRSDFVRWGFPNWGGAVTGALEVVSAVLIAFPATRLVGLALGAAIIAAAILTVLRHRDFSHLVPLGVFAALLALSLGA